jgi:site-specific DNA-cytosine methylase
MIKILELFAGSRSFGKQAKKMGFEVFSVDWDNFEGIDLNIDIELLTSNHIPFIPNVIWASPDCKTYSIAAISHHRKGSIAISDYAKKCDNVNKNFINLIMYYLSINPKLLYFIENPRGMFRKMDFIQFAEIRNTVSYCQYGDNRMKPTDIFTNCKQWQPKPICKRGDNCHVSAPRGSRTGTQGLKGSYNRSVIPSELCIEILKSITI